MAACETYPYLLCENTARQLDGQLVAGFMDDIKERNTDYNPDSDVAMALQREAFDVITYVDNVCPGLKVDDRAERLTVVYPIEPPDNICETECSGSVQPTY